MEIFLPVAGVKVNIFAVLLLGLFVGFLSGLLGIGGGIILNPALIKLGIPPIVTVGTSISQMVGATVSGFLAHLRLKNIDIKLGIYMVLSGFVGGGVGVFLTYLLENAGIFREVLLSLYSFYLGFTGLTMLIDVIKNKDKQKKESRLVKLLSNLPLKVDFPSGRISVFIPVGIGFVAGFLAAIMGVGGGFVIIPALIYLAGFPVHKAVGMSLFQMIFVTSFLTYFHATVNYGVDIVLSLILMVGSSFGAVFGASFGQNIKKEYTKLILAIIVSAVALLSMYQLFFEEKKTLKETISVLDNPISRFAYENPSLYAIVVIVVSIIFGTIISMLSHRLKVIIEIYIEKIRVRKAKSGESRMD